MSALARLETDAGGTVISGRTASAGRARLGVQTTGQPMPVCEALTTFGRASARGDWGDAGTGAGLELAAGATYANRARRLHASIGIRSLATHSISGYEEYGGTFRSPSCLDRTAPGYRWPCRASTEKPLRAGATRVGCGTSTGTTADGDPPRGGPRRGSATVRVHSAVSRSPSWSGTRGERSRHSDRSALQARRRRGTTD